MKRITCILLTCILCFSISGCTKTYKGTDELIEKAREEIPVSDADTIDMQYGGMCTVDDTALVWFISGNQYQTHYYLPMEVEIKWRSRICLCSDIQTDVSFHGYCCFELESWVCLYCEQSKLCFCKNYG